MEWQDYISKTEDQAYEYSLQENPKDLSIWKRYLESWKERNASNEAKRWLFQRMCMEFPRNPEVWESYVSWERSLEKIEHTKMTVPSNANSQINNVLNAYNVCTSVVEKLPLNMYTDYLERAIDLMDLNLIRRVINIALENVPPRDHHKLWKPVLQFISENIINHEKDSLNSKYWYELALDKITSLPEVNIWASELLRRYFSVAKDELRWDIMRLLYNTGDFGNLLETFRTSASHLPLDLKLKYLEILDFNNQEREFKVTIKSLKSYGDKTLLSLNEAELKFLVSRRKITQAVDYLNQIINQTTSMPQFNFIYSIYVSIEFALIEASDKIEEIESGWHLNNLEKLTSNFKSLRNSLKLRLEPNSVPLWIERLKLIGNDKRTHCELLAEAVVSIDPHRTRIPGHFGQLWCIYAEIYWISADYENARIVMKQASKVPYRFLEDLEVIWCYWVSWESKISGTKRCLDILNDHVLNIPDDFETRLSRFDKDHNVPAQSILFSSKILWRYNIKLHEHSNMDLTQTYEKLLKIRCITLNQLLEYADKLENEDLFHEAISVYERGLKVFSKLDKKNDSIHYYIYGSYVTFLTRNINNLTGVGSIEYVREVFQRLIHELSPLHVDCFPFYVIMSRLEMMYPDQTSKLGALEVLLEGARSEIYKPLNKNSNPRHLGSAINLWDLALTLSAKLQDVEKQRLLFEEALELLPKKACIRFVLQFADLEISAKEYERARELYEYGTKILDSSPKAMQDEFWERWEQFELEHGDKMSFIEMANSKRRFESQNEGAIIPEGHVAFVTSKESKDSDSIANPDEINLEL